MIFNKIKWDTMYGNISVSGGGCDGCLNMDEDVKDNMGLQHTIAVLEKIYMEADFPTQVDSLEASPKDLGISRADLWAFAGLASVDTFLTHTRDVCNNDKAMRFCRN